MTPGNPFVQALASIPVAPGIAVNSIVAVSGNGPIAEDDDGVVKYTSAHLDDAESELVIHSGHSVHGHPLAIAEVRRILAYRKPVDLRKSIDGLVGLVKSVLEEDPLSGSLFVFVNRRGNYVKLVSWDRTGWCLFAKRLEHGRFRFPQAEAKQELSIQVCQLLLDGIALGGRH